MPVIRAQCRRPEPGIGIVPCKDNMLELGQRLLEANLNPAGSAINSSRDFVERELELNRDALLADLGLIAQSG